MCVPMASSRENRRNQEGCTSDRASRDLKVSGARASRTSPQTLAILESEEQQLNTIQGDLPFEVVRAKGYEEFCPCVGQAAGKLK